MKIINRYLLREITDLFFVTLLILITLFVTVRLVRLASLVINKGVSLYNIVLVYLCLIPSFLIVCIPLAVLFAVMLSFSRLSAESELVVMRTSGISLKKLSVPVFYFGLGACIAAFFVALYLKPFSYRYLSKVLFNIAKQSTTAGLNAGVFNELGSISLYFEKIEDNRIENVLLEDRRDNDNPIIMTAKRGIITSNAELAEINIYLFDGEAHQATSGTEYSLTQFSSNLIRLSLEDIYQGRFEEGKGDPRSYTLTQLVSGIEEGSKGGDLKREAKLKLELSKRFSLPFAVFLLAFLGVPFGLQPQRLQRRWGIGTSAVIGVSIFLIYFFFYSIFNALAEKQSINAYLAPWLPNFILAFAAFFILRRLYQEKYQDLYELVFGSRSS
ncbi:MAG: LPS export ABC transporter permease LptF [Candidatus Dadabacteria bacterium]|nr:MAG: LPS export ABC transporter permease LptF [Candidatus Dadabacteria bacterium]